MLLELNTLLARSRRRFVCARPPDALDLEGVLTLMVTPAEEEHLAAACRWRFHSDAQVRVACPRRARRRGLAEQDRTTQCRVRVAVVATSLRPSYGPEQAEGAPA